MVTDRLRRDYENLKQYNRISMKAGVRKILTTTHVIEAVNSYWLGNEGSITGHGTSDESTLVSSSEERLLQKMRKIR